MEQSYSYAEEALQKESAVPQWIGQCSIKHLPMKRLFDLLFSLVVIVLTLPFFLLIAIAIKISSPGKIFFSHERIGRGGKSFRCYKFRTMHSDAEERLRFLLVNDSEKAKEWSQNYKLKEDPRIIPFMGNFLRKSSLDEFPQFWNVLKGDLSVVGPRPVVSDEIEKYYGVKAAKILSIRPGLTCLWQISGRSNTDYTTRIALDELYVDTHSLRKDLLVILKTIPCVLLARGAY